MFPKVSTSEVHLLSQPFSLQLAFWSDADVVTMGFNLLFIFCVWNCWIVHCSFSRSWAESNQVGVLGKDLSLTAHSCRWVLGRSVMDAGMPHSTLHELHWLISFSLALGSGCLIKCKHLNDLSCSVDFLSIILAKLFALLTSWQVFQVIWKCFVNFCTSLDLSRTVIKQWRGVKRQFTFYEKCRYPGEKLLSLIEDLWSSEPRSLTWGEIIGFFSQGKFCFFPACGWYNIP